MLNKIINTEKTFKIKTPFEVKGFEKKHEFTPKSDNYSFDKQVTEAVLAGLVFNKKTLIQGLHGSGKSSHIEQIASRLNWPVIRINLDNQISRFELLGRETIKLKDGKQITEFQEGLLIKAIRNGYVLILDEYDAATPETMFIIQRLLEENGILTLLETNEIITPHKNFRLFATCNTIGEGSNGIYHGVSNINQGQLDRWQQIVKLDYLEYAQELSLLTTRFKETSKELIEDLLNFSTLIRQAFQAQEINQIISTRTLINILEHYKIFKHIEKAIKNTYLNRLNEDDLLLVNEFYQRIFATDLNSKKEA
jgi:cobaltochelatase CobS